MRRVGLSDLDVATRALLVLPRGAWDAAAADLVKRAHAADVWRKRTGSAHPAGGTGSLYAQAALQPCAPNAACEAQYCAALAVVLKALDVWRGTHLPDQHKDA